MTIVAGSFDFTTNQRQRIQNFLCGFSIVQVNCTRPRHLIRHCRSQSVFQWIHNNDFHALGLTPSRPLGLKRVCLDLHRVPFWATKFDIDVISMFARIYFTADSFKCRSCFSGFFTRRRVYSFPFSRSIANNFGRTRNLIGLRRTCLLYTSPSPRDKRQSRMPSSA